MLPKFPGFVNICSIILRNCTCLAGGILPILTCARRLDDAFFTNKISTLPFDCFSISGAGFGGFVLLY